MSEHVITAEERQNIWLRVPSTTELVERLLTALEGAEAERDAARDGWGRAVQEATDLDGALGQRDGESLLDAAHRVGAEVARLRAALLAAADGLSLAATWLYGLRREEIEKRVDAARAAAVPPPAAQGGPRCARFGWVPGALDPDWHEDCCPDGEKHRMVPRTHQGFQNSARHGGSDYACDSGPDGSGGDGPAPRDTSCEHAPRGSAHNPPTYHPPAPVTAGGAFEGAARSRMSCHEEPGGPCPLHAEPAAPAREGFAEWHARECVGARPGHCDGTERHSPGASRRWAGKTCLEVHAAEAGARGPASVSDFPPSNEGAKTDKPTPSPEQASGEREPAGFRSAVAKLVGRVMSRRAYGDDETWTLVCAVANLMMFAAPDEERK